MAVPDQSPRILGVTINFVALSGVAVAATIFARLSYMAGNPARWDDCLIMVAWLRPISYPIVWCYIAAITRKDVSPGEKFGVAAWSTRQ